MEPPKLVKVVAAFVAGVVLALGSALIYVRVSEMVGAQPAVAVAQSIPSPSSEPAAPQLPDAAPASSAPAATSAPVSTPAPASVPQPKKPKTRISTMTRRVAAPAPRKQPKIAMAQLAENRPQRESERVIYSAPPAQIDMAPLGTSPSSPMADGAPAPAEASPQAPEPNPLPQPHVVTLAAGTAIPVRLAENLSTDHNYTGDTFRGTLEAPIIMDGFVIADRGSKVLGRVVSSEKAGRIQGTANLNLTLTEINTTDGQRVHVETSAIGQRGRSSTGDEAATIAGVTALGAVIGAVAGGGKGAAIGAGIGGAAGTGAVLATRGKPATLPVETRLTFRLAAPLTITEKLN